MFRRMTLVLAATALAVSGSSLATAATSTTKHKAKSHAVTATASIANISPPGPIAQGTQSYAGTVDGTIAGKAVTGALRGVNHVTGTSFTGTLTEFSAAGTLKATIAGAGSAGPNGSVVYSGTGKYVGGTGTYKGAKGSFTFTGNTAPAPPAGVAQTDYVAAFKLTGSAKY